MTDEDTGRREALDQFAKATGDSTSVAVQPQAHNILAGQVFGAQQVAVHRSTTRVLAQIKELAAAAGADWYYRFPVKDKNGVTSFIEGPSVKLANDVSRLYGNCEVDCRAQDLGNVILFHARFVDLETGYALTRPFQQRKGASKMGDADRRADIDFQIGASKAIRNVVVNALQTFSDFAFEEARNALVERIGKDLDRWRTKTAERLTAKVDLKRVEAVVGRSAKDWLAPDVARIIAMGKACEDGMSTWDETFPPVRPAADNDNTPHDPSTGEVLDAFAAAGPPPGGEKATADANEPAMFEGEAVAADNRPEMLAKLFKLVNAKTPPDERLEVLDVTRAMLLDLSPEHAEFIQQATQWAAKVVRGEVTGNDAKKYLEGLIK